MISFDEYIEQRLNDQISCYDRKNSAKAAERPTGL